MMEMFGTLEQARTDEVANALLDDREHNGHNYVYLTEEGVHWIWEWNGDRRPHGELRFCIGAVLTVHEGGEVSVVRHDRSTNLELEAIDIASRAEAMSWTP
jgi:hypothetical protein